MKDYAGWQLVFLVGSGAVNVVAWVGAWICNKDKARTKDIAEVAADIQAMGNRVTRLEETQINHEDLAKVYERINRVADQLSEMKGEMKGSLGNIGGSVDMILECLLKTEKRG